MNRSMSVNPSQDDLSWSQLYAFRRRIREMYPSIWKIPIIKKVPEILLKQLGPEDHLLDIGACDRHLKDQLASGLPSLTYKSMDVDRRNNHDYYNLSEIHEGFNAACMLECIEHLSLEVGRDTLSHIHRVLKPGGTLFVSTPNTFHPNRYWECTHQVPFRYDELGGFLEMSHFSVRRIYRIYNDHFLGRLFRIYLMQPMHRYLDIDFAKSILIEAERRELPEGEGISS